VDCEYVWTYCVVVFLLRVGCQDYLDELAIADALRVLERFQSVFRAVTKQQQLLQEVSVRVFWKLGGWERETHKMRTLA
jgi:hypothetical protein